MLFGIVPTLLKVTKFPFGNGLGLARELFDNGPSLIRTQDLEEVWRMFANEIQTAKNKIENLNISTKEAISNAGFKSI